MKCLSLLKPFLKDIVVPYREEGCGGEWVGPSHSRHEQSGKAECPWCHCPNSSCWELSTLPERTKTFITIHIISNPLDPYLKVRGLKC